jgi:hypothetical protein
LTRILADFVLVAHAAVVAFNVLSLPLIWLGWLLRWRFVHNYYFRATHLLLIGFVAAEATLGVVCPLTAWENALRVRQGSQGYETGFFAHWVHKLIYYDLHPSVFVVGYLAFFCLVLATWFIVKPEKRGRTEPRHRDRRSKAAGS